MGERPILFSAPMVRSILDGRKTVTRRLVKPQPYIDGMGNFCWNGWNFGQDSRRPLTQAIASPLPSSKTKRVLCPYGASGDRLWVREAWAQPTTLDPGPTAYRADYPNCLPKGMENVPPAEAVRWRPSIHMPRALSRITLEITDVRVERLQDISEDDCIAEGIEQRWTCLNPGAGSYAHENDVRDDYWALWERINGAGSWDANPWVWCVSFRRIEPAKERA